MLIDRSPGRERQLLDALRQSFKETRGRDGDNRVHLSDLLNPRKSYWGRTTDTLPTDTEALYWAAGRAHEDVITRLGGSVDALAAGGHGLASAVCVPGLAAGEYREQLGISYRPDFRWFNRPAEMKTIRRTFPAAESFQDGVIPDGFEGFLEQLLGYCVLDNVSRGHLIVFDLMTPALGVCDVEFSDSELENWRLELKTRLAWFQYALKGKLHSQLPLCQEWMCGTRRKRELAPANCQDCRKDLSPKQVQAHQKSKRKYRYHLVVPAITTWDYTPNCKWYSECKPWEQDEIRREWK